MEGHTDKQTDRIMSLNCDRSKVLVQTKFKFLKLTSFCTIAVEWSQLSEECNRMLQYYP
jgi:hypothetical protein